MQCSSKDYEVIEACVLGYIARHEEQRIFQVPERRELVLNMSKGIGQLLHVLIMKALQKRLSNAHEREVFHWAQTTD